MAFSILRALSTPSRHLQRRQWEPFHYPSRKKEESFFSFFIFLSLPLLQDPFSAWPFSPHKLSFFPLCYISTARCRTETTAWICSAQPRFTQEWILGEGGGITSSLSWSCSFLLTVSFPWHPTCPKSTEHHWAGQVPVQYSCRLLVNSRISQSSV